MFFIRQLIKLIRLLHQDEGALLLSIGFSLGIFAGWCGWVSILGFLSLVIALVFRVQLGAYFLGSAIFAVLSLPLLTTFHTLGKQILQNESLKPLWTSLYQQPVFHWFKFNNTVVMGGSLMALLAFPFIFALTYWGIVKYQKAVLSKIRQTKIYKFFIKSTPIVLYQKYIEKNL